MLGVSPSSTPQEREGKATYDRYEVRLQAVQVQGVWRCRRVVRRTRGGSGRRGLGAAPQQWVPVSPVWAAGARSYGSWSSAAGATSAFAAVPSGCTTALERSAVRPTAGTSRRCPGRRPRPGQLPLRIPAAEVLPVDAAGHRRALAGPGSFDPVRSVAPAHRAPAHGAPHPRADDPRHRRDLLRQGP